MLQFDVTESVELFLVAVLGESEGIKVPKGGRCSNFVGKGVQRNRRRGLLASRSKRRGAGKGGKNNGGLHGQLDYFAEYYQQNADRRASRRRFGKIRLQACISFTPKMIWIYISSVSTALSAATAMPEAGNAFFLESHPLRELSKSPNRHMQPVPSVYMQPPLRLPRPCIPKAQRMNRST